MLTYKGIDALPAFRQRQLLNQLKVISPSINGIAAEYIHFVDTKKKLGSADSSMLEKLLTYGKPFDGKRSHEPIIIIPRIGTMSPWSSKATDIARNSGLKNIKRIERGSAYYIDSSDPAAITSAAALLHDKMTETALFDIEKASLLFVSEKPKTYRQIDLKDGPAELHKANTGLGLALSESEIKYLYKSYKELGRNPSDAELMMFSVVNSEHCRHKIFNADWIIDDKKQPKSLFRLIKNTYKKNSLDILSAYSDNAAVLKGSKAARFYPSVASGTYGHTNEEAHIVIKVETHNHPTAVAPIPGAATGVGGEIRDEGATGRGAKPKMGLSGFSVSNLNIPNYQQPWEKYYGKPTRIASALDIMVDAPIGGASFNNEFGRPNLAGYFRTYEQEYNGQAWGYHKPIMIAGGVGNIKDEHVEKFTMPRGTQLVVLGGPSMLIGLGGGTASSMQTGESEENLDFASVQRANAEIERRAQEVINTCWSLGKSNPILTIHDVGAGGLSNALPELVHDSRLGAKFELRNIPNAEPGMSPMEIWCNEAQERYVLGINTKDVKTFEAICKRERCPLAVVGVTTKKEELILHDDKFNNTPVNIPMELLFGNPPKMTRIFTRTTHKKEKFNTTEIKIEEAVKRVLQMPVVGSKKFLITIGDRSVGGLTVRDQMVGPWQVPVSDVAVTASSFAGKTGEAMAMGERAPLALINSAASARMAVGETITNIAAAPIEKISDIKLSANWMAATGYKNEDQNLYDAVNTLGDDFCPALGITIPVGKDSLSMRTAWHENQTEKAVTSPLSVVISGFAPVSNTSGVLTPQLSTFAESELILIDLGENKNRLGGSVLAQAYSQIGNKAPDIRPDLLKSFFRLIQNLNKEGLLLAYHDRSDGGLFATICEMAFAGRCGISIDLKALGSDNLSTLFNEELGAVIQVRKKDSAGVIKNIFAEIGNCAYTIGSLSNDRQITIKNGDKIVYENSRAELESWWSSTSYQIQALRDNPACAVQEFNNIKDDVDPGLSPSLTFDLNSNEYAYRPKAAIFREQGVNGQVEMAAAFDRAGFESVDVHLNDIIGGRFSLKDFSVLAVCGGFSYGDVLGAGEGWAKSILYNQKLKAEFKEFFVRENTLSLGVCNGCQMLSGLKEIIPGAALWPKFKKNISEQFEARLVSVKINKSKSAFFKNMEGSVVPIPVAHGEGKAVFDKPVKISSGLVPLQYVDNYGKVTEKYPFNPNGSAEGITSLTSEDGRATILMPHPERGFLTQQYSWHPTEWEEDGPWFKIFQNARDWVEENGFKR